MSENEQDLSPPSIAEIRQSMVLAEEAKAIRRQYLSCNKSSFGLAAEKLMEDLCQAWWRSRTKEQRTFFKGYMRALREAQKNDKALGDLVLHKGERPEDLSNAIGFILDNKEWARDPDLLATFYRVFRLGALNTTSKGSKR